MWPQEFNDRELLKDPKTCIAAAKAFVKFCRREYNQNEGYKFIFWALMILAVDKTDAEEHLTLICDFARMLRITDDELEDIVHVIKIILYEPDTSCKFISSTTQGVFSNVVNVLIEL